MLWENSFILINEFTKMSNLQVKQRDVPGIDNAFLAMDTEEGVEVVWNEVQFSANRNLKDQQVYSSGELCTLYVIMIM